MEAKIRNQIIGGGWVGAGKYIEGFISISEGVIFLKYKSKYGTVLRFNEAGL